MFVHSTHIIIGSSRSAVPPSFWRRSITYCSSAWVTPPPIGFVSQLISTRVIGRPLATAERITISQHESTGDGHLGVAPPRRVHATQRVILRIRQCVSQTDGGQERFCSLTRTRLRSEGLTMASEPASIKKGRASKKRDPVGEEMPHKGLRRSLQTR
jgi:hypothetical protein